MKTKDFVKIAPKIVKAELFPLMKRRERYGRYYLGKTVFGSTETHHKWLWRKHGTLENMTVLKTAEETNKILLEHGITEFIALPTESRNYCKLYELHKITEKYRVSIKQIINTIYKEWSNVFVEITEKDVCFVYGINQFYDIDDYLTVLHTSFKLSTIEKQLAEVILKRHRPEITKHTNWWAVPLSRTLKNWDKAYTERYEILKKINALFND